MLGVLCLPSVYTFCNFFSSYEYSHDLNELISVSTYGRQCASQNQARVIRRPKFSSSGKLLIGQLWIRKFEFNFSEVLRLALSKTHCSRIELVMASVS